MLDDEATEEIDDCQEETEPDVPFDYGSLPAETVKELEAAVPVLRRMFKKLDNEARKTGDYLIGLKKKAGHGLFLKWLQVKLPGPMGAKRAQRLMKLACYCQEYAIACANLSEPTMNLFVRTKGETAREVLARAEQRGVPLTDDEARDELPAPLGRKGKVPKEKTEKAQPATVQALGSVSGDPDEEAREEEVHQELQNQSTPAVSNMASIIDETADAGAWKEADRAGVKEALVMMEECCSENIAAIIEVLKAVKACGGSLDFFAQMLETRFATKA